MSRVVSFIVISFVFLFPALSPVYAASHEKTEVTADATKVDTATTAKPEEEKKADDADEEPECD